MELKEDEKQCPFCKKIIHKDATICPYCRKDLSVSGNVAAVLKAVGGILTICITIPIVMFACGMCSIP
jgi:predicted amidophosphoribosyltransferase